VWADRRVYWRGGRRQFGRSAIELSVEHGLRAQLDKLPHGLRPKLGRDERVVVIDNPQASGGRYAQHGVRAQHFYRILATTARS